MRARRIHLLWAVVAAALAAQAACGTTTGLLVRYDNVVDTVVLYALAGTPISAPSGFVLADGDPVRTDRAVVLDFVFNITPAGQAVLLSTGALSLGRSSGFIPQSQAFDAITIAPSGGYQDSLPQPVDSGSVLIVRSTTPSPTCAGYYLSLPIYAKLEVLAIDSVARTMKFQILVDKNCGYHGLQPGRPSR